MQHITIKEKLKKHRWAIREWAAVSGDILYSEAFSVLSATSIRVLLRFIQKRKYHKEGKRKKKVVYENNPIIFTYNEAECFSISRSSFARAIRELIEKGFIEIEHQGGTVGNGNDCSTYRLIDDWKDYGTDKFIPRVKHLVPPYNDSIKRFNEKRKKDRLAKMKFSSVRNDTESVSEVTPEA
jgi:predicted transcriptional regulator